MNRIGEITHSVEGIKNSIVLTTISGLKGTPACNVPVDTGPIATL